MSLHSNASYLKKQLMNNPDFNELTQITVQQYDGKDNTETLIWDTTNYDKEILVGDKGLILFSQTEIIDEFLPSWLEDTEKSDKQQREYLWQNFFVKRSGLALTPYEFYTIPKNAPSIKVVQIVHPNNTHDTFVSITFKEIEFKYKSGATVTIPGGKDQTFFKIKKEN